MAGAFAALSTTWLRNELVWRRMPFINAGMALIAAAPSKPEDQRWGSGPMRPLRTAGPQASKADKMFVVRISQSYFGATV
jgi:hypothetical protein